MKTNTQTDAPFITRGNRVLAVIDDAIGVRQAVQELRDLGVPRGAIATLTEENGVHKLDAHRAYRGRLARLLRGLPTVPLEGDQLDRYASEVAHGHNVLDVPVPPTGLRDRIIGILKAHGAHFINAYGFWTIEQVVA